MPHPFFPGRGKNKTKQKNGVRFRNENARVRRTDDDIRVPVREARVEQDATDLFLPAATRSQRRRRRGQVDIHVIGPLQPHARTPLVAQRALVAACADDGQSNEVLYEDEPRRGESQSAQWRADEDGEL